MRGKPGNEVLNTTVTNTQTLNLFLLHMCSYYSTFIVAYTRIARYDFANAILYFAYCKYSEQLASEFVSIRVYCSILCTKEHCTMYTTMHAFHSFFKEKYCTLIVYITEFSLKIGGGVKYITGPPNLNFGGPWPPGPPIADPMQ